MKPRARIGLRLLGIFFAASLLVYAALFFLLRSTAFRQWAETELSRRSGMDVRLADLSLRPPFHLVAGALEVSKPGEFLFRSPRLQVTFTPVDLWLGTVHRVSAERPVLTIDLAEMMKPAGASSATVGLRYLKIHDGSIVLKRGGAEVFELPNINLEARNLNLGQASGIHLRADVPSLQGEAEVHLGGALNALTGEIVLRSKPASRTFSDGAIQQEQPEFLRVRAKLDAPEDQQATATIEGRFEKLAAGAGRISGSLNARATIDSDWKEFLFAGDAAVRSIAEALGPAGAKLPGWRRRGEFFRLVFIGGQNPYGKIRPP